MPGRSADQSCHVLLQKENGDGCRYSYKAKTRPTPMSHHQRRLWVDCFGLLLRRVCHKNSPSASFGSDRSLPSPSTHALGCRSGSSGIEKHTDATTSGFVRVVV